MGEIGKTIVWFPPVTVLGKGYREGEGDILEKERDKMPEISRFYGIVISMFYDDHSPPHFHARYSGYKIAIEINSLRILDGNFPPRALGLVMEWTSLHKDELLKNWDLARQNLPPQKIDPLK